MADIRDKFSDLDPDVLKGMAKKERFFHDMQLTDEFRTGSWVYGDSLPPNYHLWPVFSYLNQIDLTGQTCLDIGTYDGMTAFVMAEKGSARVDATCQFDLDRFRIVRALKKYQTIHYHPQTDIKSMSQSFDAGAYDVVVISAMLHHLTSPFDGLAEARRLLRRNGLFILEAAVFDRPDAAIYLNTEIEDPVYGAPTIFIPSVRALRGMLKLACFDVLSETRMLGTKDSREPNYERFTFLARAVRPEEVQARTKKTEEIHTSVASVGDLNFKQLSNEQASSTVHYAGQKGTRNLNVWTHREDYPLSPPGRAASAEFKTLFSVAREKDFMKLVGRVPDGAFSWQDVYLLGVRYPGETMPEGMTWSVKQLGNLHVLDYVRRQGTAEVIEVGPGFNFYFINHLPEWCTYTGLDSSGFYDKELVTAANRARKQVRMLEGLLGQSIDGLAANSVDACISVSVLEHVPEKDRGAVCRHMFEILKPGGWALHSIDLQTHVLQTQAEAWLKDLQVAGFELAPGGIDMRFGGERSEADRGEIFNEPLSIRARFQAGYKASIWNDASPPYEANFNTSTVLVAARKPDTAASTTSK